MCCFVSWRKQLQPAVVHKCVPSSTKNRRSPITFPTYGPIKHLWHPSWWALKTSPKTPVQPDPGTSTGTASPVSINIKENQQPAEADTALEFSHTTGGRLHQSMGKWGNTSMEMGKWGNLDINPFFLLSLLLLPSPFLEPQVFVKAFSIFGKLLTIVPIAIDKLLRFLCPNYIPLSAFECSGNAMGCGKKWSSQPSLAFRSKCSSRNRLKFSRDFATSKSLRLTHDAFVVHECKGCHKLETILHRRYLAGFIGKNTKVDEKTTSLKEKRTSDTPQLLSLPSKHQLCCNAMFKHSTVW